MKRNAFLLISILLIIKIDILYCQTPDPVWCNTTTDKYSTGYYDFWLSLKHDDDIRAGLAIGTLYAGWSVFDISQIPDNATITSIKLYVTKSKNSTSSSHCLYITKLSSDPRTASVSDIRSEVDVNYQNCSMLYSGCSPAMTTDWGLNIIELNNNAISDLNFKVTNNVSWWAIGLSSNREDFGVLDGYSKLGHPMIEVSYTTPPNLTFSSSNNVLNVNGTNVNLSMRVINNGGSPSSGCYVTYYLSNNSTFETTDYEIGRDNIPALGAGSYSDESLSVDVAGITPLIPVGSYYVGYIIDYQNSVNEFK